MALGTLPSGRLCRVSCFATITEYGSTGFRTMPDTANAEGAWTWRNIQNLDLSFPCQLHATTILYTNQLCLLRSVDLPLLFAACTLTSLSSLRAKAPSLPSVSSSVAGALRLCNLTHARPHCRIGYIDDYLTYTHTTYPED